MDGSSWCWAGSSEGQLWIIAYKNWPMKALYNPRAYLVIRKEFKALCQAERVVEYTGYSEGLL